MEALLALLPDEVPVWLTGGGLFALVVWILEHPDEAQAWYGRGWSLLSWLGSGVGRRAAKNRIEGAANQFLSSEIYSGVVGVRRARLSINWVKNAEDLVLRQDDVVIVRMRDERDPARNVLNLVRRALPTVLYPRARAYIDGEFNAAVDLHILKTLAGLLSADAEGVFSRELLGPEVDGSPTLQDLLSQLGRIDRRGLFRSVLLQELVDLDSRVGDEVPGPDLHSELRRLVERLCWLAERHRGDESEPLLFVDKYVRVGFILLSRKTTAELGRAPYVRRMLLHFNQGARTVHLIGLLPGQADLCQRIVDSVRDLPGIGEPRESWVAITVDGSRVHLPIVSFGREDLALIQGSELYEDAGLEPGAAATGVVTQLLARDIMLDVGGLPVRMRGRDIAWGYTGSPEGLGLQTGQELTCVVLGTDPADFKAFVGLKQADDDPWELGLVPSVGDQVEGRVIEEFRSRIIVQLNADPPLFGYVAREDWSKLAVASEAYPEVKSGADLDFRVVRIDRQTDTVQLNRSDLEEFDWVSAAKDFPAGTRVRATVVQVTHQGILCELTDGLVGWLPDFELRGAGFELADWTDTVVVGQKLDVVVRNVGEARERITLRLARNA